MYLKIILFLFENNLFLILVDCTWALAYLLDCGNHMIQVDSLIYLFEYGLFILVDC
jgi:hypothetical protein